MEAVPDGIHDDPLTGLLNRTAFMEALEQEVQSAEHDTRSKPQFLTLVLLDVDRIKSYNDKYGHVVGNQFLAEIATVLRETVRPTDHAGRFGGDEFALLLLGRSHTQVDALLSRLRANLPKETKPTVSLGAASWQRGNSVRDLVQRADLALYETKHPRGGD